MSTAASRTILTILTSVLPFCLGLHPSRLVRYYSRRLTIVPYWSILLLTTFFFPLLLVTPASIIIIVIIINCLASFLVSASLLIHFPSAPPRADETF